MQVRSSIFDSEAEKQLFAAVAGVWEPKFRLYPQLPFVNLIRLHERELDAAQLSFLHKTTVDFVLAQEDGTPLLGIEFDGLAHGVSTRGRYQPGIDIPKGRGRAWKLDLKVRVAEAACFPFVVVSYPEKEFVEASTRLTIVHGIVGSFLARIATMERVAELLEQEADTLSELSPADRHEQIQDMVLCAELDADSEWNPVFKRSIELSTALHEACPLVKVAYSYDEDPARPERCDPWSDDYDEDLLTTWWKSIRRHGVTCTIETPSWTIARTVWVRNFEGRGVSPFGWMNELAEVVAIPEALKHLVAGTAPG